MTLLPSSVKIVALGVTDMHKGLDGLSMLVQSTLKQDPASRLDELLPWNWTPPV